MAEDAQTGSRRRHSWTWWTLWACAILFIVYPLSLGPVMRLGSALHPPEALDAILTTVYAPIAWLCEHVPVVQAFFEWYLLDLWGVSMG